MPSLENWGGGLKSLLWHANSPHTPKEERKRKRKEVERKEVKTERGKVYKLGVSKTRVECTTVCGPQPLQRHRYLLQDDVETADQQEPV